MSQARPVPKPAKPRHFVRQWRKHRGYTQEQLAEMIGVTHGAISQLERGHFNYTQPMLEAIADALMCEPGDLVMRDPLSSQSIWSVWEHASIEQRDQIVRIAETIIRKKSG
jgi:transcriptional regulator with XRE-family HTH domain